MPQPQCPSNTASVDVMMVFPQRGGKLIKSLEILPSVRRPWVRDPGRAAIPPPRWRRAHQRRTHRPGRGGRDPRGVGHPPTPVTGSSSQSSRRGGTCQHRVKSDLWRPSIRPNRRPVERPVYEPLGRHKTRSGYHPSPDGRNERQKWLILLGSKRHSNQIDRRRVSLTVAIERPAPPR